MSPNMSRGAHRGVAQGGGTWGHISQRFVALPYSLVTIFECYCR